MKRFFYLFLLCTIHLSAKTIQGHIVNTDNVPLKNVAIENIVSQMKVHSDNSGFFEIDGNDSDTIVFSLIGYSTTELTIRNILNSKNKILLFREMRLDLPEVTIMPTNMYDLYRKAVLNLTNRFVTDSPVAYKCTGVEKEINYGDERGIDLLFSAQTKKINRKKTITAFIYDIYISELNTYIGSQDSYILRENRLWTNFMDFPVSNTLREDSTNTMQINDSTIIIQICRHQTLFATFTINKEDTTLIKVTQYESLPKGNKYQRRRTFKCKELFYSYSTEFRETENGYIQYKNIFNYDCSMLKGNPEREERIIISYTTVNIDNPLPKSGEKFKPDTKKLYEMKHYP